MLALSFAAAIALMMGLPIVLAAFVTRGLGMPGRFVLIGAATFLVAQALRLPVLHLLTSGIATGLLPAPAPAHAAAVNILVLALTAGVFEESARYAAYRAVIPDAPSWTAAVAFGAGHGGIESVLLGALMGLEFLRMVMLGSAPAVSGLSADATAELARQAAQYWSLPAYMPLLGAAERIFALTFHLAMAVLVLAAVKRRNLLLLLLAVALHAATNALAVVALQAYGPVAAEAALLAIAALAALYLVRSRRRDNAGRPIEPAHAPAETPR